MHADERDGGDRQHAYGEMRVRQERSVAGRVARHDERPISSAAQHGRSKASCARELFAALAAVVFGHPSTPQRDQLIVRLAPGAPLGDLTSDREPLARIVGPRLEPWLREGAPALQKSSAEDRRLLEPGFLYVCYHRCVPQLDALIETQAGQGGAALTA